MKTFASSGIMATSGTMAVSETVQLYTRAITSQAITSLEPGVCAVLSVFVVNCTAGSSCFSELVEPLSLGFFSFALTTGG